MLVLVLLRIDVKEDAKTTVVITVKALSLEYAKASLTGSENYLTLTRPARPLYFQTTPPAPVDEIFSLFLKCLLFHGFLCITLNQFCSNGSN